jgi:divalent metal cation (Fe/Co/Zn/Cd) transporter
VTAIRTLLENDSRILHLNEASTLHMGPSHIIVMLSVDFADQLDSSEVERATTEFNRQIKAIDPAIRRVFVEAERFSDHQPVEPV